MLPARPVVFSSGVCYNPLAYNKSNSGAATALIYPLSTQQPARRQTLA
jgi:hypothetical protein